MDETRESSRRAHAERPEVAIGIHRAVLQTFGRQIRMITKVVRRHASRGRDGLGDTEVEDLDAIALEQADVARRQVAVQKKARAARRST